MDIEQALQNPCSAFARPEDVLRDSSLNREQKILILRRWEYDARELDVAEEENMGGGPPSMLGEVLTALHRLDSDRTGEPSPPTKHGGA